MRSSCGASGPYDGRRRILGAIDASEEILTELRTFNKGPWVVRYPQLREQPEPQPEEAPADNTSSAPRRKSLRRSLSFADDPTFQTDVVVAPTRKGMPRSVTLTAIPEPEEPPVEEEDNRLLPSSDAHDFHLLKLDLKLGAHGSSSAPASLVSQLEKASIANLIDDRIGAAMNHMEKLRLRVEDTSSKVLVTGDLNAGKSTFVNALLRRDVMPVDQQPCTTAFCEVHDAAENNGKEELHIVKEGVTYCRDDESTYTRADLSELDSIVSENEDVQRILKVYLADGRSPSESLLNNGVVDISLIDAPGLNRDSMKTTALFARQEEIDVVVFVVSAENHFTLSAKEFLWNASNEKAYLFIVVNKYEQIRDKAKCRRLVLEQIKQLSPRTYEDAEDLVHFVDSAAALQSGTSSFSSLESALRSFVLVKRAKSKLTPASTYLTHLLSDIDFLVSANAIVAQTELERTREDLSKSRPVLDKMQKGRESFEDSLEGVEESGATRARVHTKEILLQALDRVAQGRLAISKPGFSLPAYPGIWRVWEYASEVRKAFLTSLDLAVEFAQDEARTTTSSGVNKIATIGDESLPMGVERSRRVFMPEAMFSARGGDKKARRRPGRGAAVVAGGIYGLGIGLAQRPDMLETSFFDIFDLQHQLWVQFADKSHQEEDPRITALSVASIGIGALTLVGGKAIGARSVIEGIVRVSDLFGNESSRKWAGPILGAIAICATGYYIMELPSTIPRTIGRRIHASLIKVHEDEETYVDEHALRISQETRKVLRLASWDLRERFRKAMDEANKDVKTAEELEKNAQKAVEDFNNIQQKTAGVRENAQLASLAE